MSFCASSTARMWCAAFVLTAITGAVGWWVAGAWPHHAAETGMRSVVAPTTAGGAVAREIETVLSGIAREKSSSRQFAILAAAPLPRTSGALRAWLDRLESLPNVEARELAQRLLTRDGSAIPFEEMAAILSETSSRASGTLAQAWAEREGLSGLERALSLQGTSVTFGVTDEMARVCARTDPEGTLAILLKHSDPPRSIESALGAVFAEWVKRDPQKATARFASLTTPQRNSAAYHLVDTWARTDPHQALAWAREQSGEMRQSMMHAALGRWSQTDPELAAKTMLEEVPAIQLSSVWYYWSQRDPEGMHRWVEAQTDLPWEAQNQALSILARSLVTSDSARAWSLGQNLSGNERRNLVSAISRELLAKDPNAAMAWSANLSDRSDREHFYAAINQLEGITSEVRDTILDLLPDNEPQAVSAQLALLTKTDAASAKAYWESLDPDMRLPLTRQIISGLVETSPETAATIVREKLADQDFGSSTDTTPAASARWIAMDASRVAVALAGRDPDAAKEWLASLRPSLEVAEAATNFAAHYGRFDRPDVEEWLATQPHDSPLRSGLLRGLARLDMSLGDPGAALAMVSQMAADDPARPNALRALYQVWNAMDAEAAKNAFDALQLTEAERTGLGGGLGK
jgi:hypothetical protein